MIKIRGEKDFWAGLLYLVFGISFIWFGRSFNFGSSARMGPGYFPLVLAIVLSAIGAVSIFRSLLQNGAQVEGLAWRKLGIISLAIVAFGFVIEAAGVVIALPVLVILSALGSKETIFDIRSAVILVLLTAFCIVVFVKGLGVPMPIFGSLFDGIVPVTWQR